MKNPDFRVRELVPLPEIPRVDMHCSETTDDEGPRNARRVGESPSGGVAAANAIANATGVRLLNLLSTPERVCRALHGRTPKLFWKPWNAP